MSINMRKARLPLDDLERAKRLMGFDYGGAVYHVLCFDWGEDGGAIGVWREGSEFCARFALDELVQFWVTAAMEGYALNRHASASHAHDACLRAIELLMKGDPPLDSPEGALLSELADAVEKYEKRHDPLSIEPPRRLK